MNVHSEQLQGRGLFVFVQETMGFEGRDQRGPEGEQVSAAVGGLLEDGNGGVGASGEEQDGGVASSGLGAVAGSNGLLAERSDVGDFLEGAAIESDGGPGGAFDEVGVDVVGRLSGQGPGVEALPESVEVVGGDESACGETMFESILP